MVPLEGVITDSRLRHRGRFRFKSNGKPEFRLEADLTGDGGAVGDHCD